MAKPINATPVLKGEDAKRFIKNLNKPYIARNAPSRSDVTKIFKSNRIRK
ncbi:hypothetical protein [Methanobrevibacter sp.]